MKYSNFYIVAIALLILAGCQNKKVAEVKSGDKVYETSAQASITVSRSGNDYVFEKTETKFDVLDLNGLNPATLVISIQQKEKRVLSQNPYAKKHFSISVKSITGNRQIDWKKEFDASEITYDQKVLRINNASGEDKEDTYTIFNLDNGKKIMDYTYGEMSIQIPNTSDKRFFAYLSAQNCIGEEIEKGGIIQYASTTQLIQKLQIKQKSKIEIPDYTPEIQVLKAKNSGTQITPDGKSILLTSLTENYKPEQIKDFAFKINFYAQDVEEPYSIVIPVENDKLDLDNAYYDHAIFELKLID
jgi:hypothetical protein